MRKALTLVAAATLLAACSTSEEETVQPASSVQPTPAPVTTPSTPTRNAGDVFANIGDRVFFDSDSSALDSGDQQALQAQAAWMNEFSSVSVTVEGHCDERGTREYNLALGDRRANAVKEYLTALGVAPSRISTISYGKERPAVIGSNESAWAQNRRAVTVPN